MVNFFWPSNFCWKISRSRLKIPWLIVNSMVFRCRQKWSTSTTASPPLLILNRRRPVVLKYRCIGKWMWNITLLSSDSTKFDCFVNLSSDSTKFDCFVNLSSDSTKFDCFVNHRCNGKWINWLFIYSFMKVWVCIRKPEFKSFWKLGEKLFVLYR